MRCTRERYRAREPVDVLVIGAGVAGGVVARRLAEAGLSVVALEQGDWPDRADYPGRERPNCSPRSSGPGHRCSALLRATTRST